MVDTGIDPYVGVAAWLEAHKQNEFKYPRAQDRTALQRFGELTAAEGFLVLLPLFIVLVTFNAFSGEREQGTLRQLLIVGVRPRDLMAGKALGVAMALALVLVPATIVGVAGLMLTAEFGALADDAWRAVTLTAVYLTYFAARLRVLSPAILMQDALNDRLESEPFNRYRNIPKNLFSRRFNNWLQKDVSRCLPVSDGVSRVEAPVRAQSGAQISDDQSDSRVSSITSQGRAGSQSNSDALPDVVSARPVRRWLVRHEALAVRGPRRRGDTRPS